MRERDILLAALEKSTPGERASFLHEACGDDAVLLARVEALLQAAEREDSFLERPADDNATSMFRGDLSGGNVDHPPALDFLKPSDDPQYLGLLGQYRILDWIGSGGMGIVLRALDPKLNRIVAVKVLAPHLSAQGNARQRFLREAQAAAAVVHPHVITIHAVDEQHETPYLVMEYVDGRSLLQKIQAQGALPLKEILRIGAQIAAGLAAAHAQGLIHRDIKPGNIMLENGVERVKITDFGLARAADDARMTKSGSLAGTPDYMSPEQARGDSLDHRSDLFSLGCVLYAMCTGRSPFRASTLVGAIHRVCHDSPRPLREVNSEIPDWLTEIIDCLLSKDPAQRIQSATEVARLLEEHLACLQQPVAVPRPARIRIAAPSASAHAPARRRLLIAAAVTAGVLLAALIVLEGTGATRLGHLWWSAANRVASEPDTSEPTPPRLVVDPTDSSDNGPSTEPPADSSKSQLDVMTWHPQIRVDVEGPLQKSFQNTDRAATYRVVTERVPAGRYDVRVVNTLTNEIINKGSLTLKPGEVRRLEVFQTPYMRPRSPMAQSLATLTGHSSRLSAIRYSHDGHRIVTADESGMAIIWNREQDQWSRLATLGGRQGEIWSAVFSPDDQHILTAGNDGTIRVWDSDDGELRQTLDAHQGAIRRIAFSPASSSAGRRLLSCGDDGFVKVWSWSAAELNPEAASQFVAHEGPVNWFSLSADGTRLATAGSNGLARIWDVEDVKRDKPLHELRGHTAHLNFAEFSPDGQTLATGGRDSLLILWDVASGKPRRTLGHEHLLYAAGFAPDGKTLAVADYQFLQLWNVEDGTPFDLLHAHWASVMALAIAPDGKTVATAGKDYAAKIWDLEQLRREAPKPEPMPPQPKTTFYKISTFFLAPVIAFSRVRPELLMVGARAIKETDGTPFWNTRERNVIKKLVTHRPHRGFFLPDDMLMTLGFEENGPATIQTWDVLQGRMLLESKLGWRAPTCGQLAASGQYLALMRTDPWPSAWPAAKIVAWPSGGEVAQIPLSVAGQPCGQHVALDCSPVEDLVAVGTSGGFITLWGIPGAQSLCAPLKHGNQRIWSVKFSADGSILASASADSTIALWDLRDSAKPQLLRVLRGHKVDAMCAAFSPDGRWLATGGGTRGGNPLAPYRHDAEIRIWDVATGRPLVAFQGHRECVEEAEFSADGALLATSGHDGKTHVWSVEELLAYGKTQNLEADDPE